MVFINETGELAVGITVTNVPTPLGDGALGEPTLKYEQKIILHFLVQIVMIIPVVLRLLANMRIMRYKMITIA